MDDVVIDSSENVESVGVGLVARRIVNVRNQFVRLISEKTRVECFGRVISRSCSRECFNVNELSYCTSVPLQ